jgi:pyruvate,water dikinase
MNGELDEALGMLTEPLPQTMPVASRQQEPEVSERRDEGHWRWRLRSVERLAAQLNPRRFGVKALYVIGSTKNATAGPHSDIDLLVHFQGTDAQMKELLTWLDGWSLCLDQVNFLRTGHKSGGLLDVHLVTDEDIRKRTGYAVKIGAVTDPARPLPLGSEAK